MTSTQTTPRALTIVGPGRVGRSFERAARAAGLEVCLLNRQEVEAGRSLFRHGDTCESHLVLLAVPDSEIANACEALCAAGRPPGPVGHLSGATGLDALGAAEAADVATFSLHPLQTFADDQTDLSGIACAVSAADEMTLIAVSKLAERLSMDPFAVAEEDRAAYHAAAAVACNFLVCLEEEAAALLGSIGVENGRQLLAPLVAQTLSNWIETGGAALTGPIARGDEETVERHLEALRHRAPHLVSVYLAMAERTRALAVSRAEGDKERVETVLA